MTGFLVSYKRPPEKKSRETDKRQGCKPFYRAAKEIEYEKESDKEFENDYESCCDRTKIETSKTE